MAGGVASLTCIVVGELIMGVQEEQPLQHIAVLVPVAGRQAGGTSRRLG